MIKLLSISIVSLILFLILFSFYLSSKRHALPYNYFKEFCSKKSFKFIDTKGEIDKHSTLKNLEQNKTFATLQVKNICTINNSITGVIGETKIAGYPLFTRLYVGFIFPSSTNYDDSFTIVNKQSTLERLVQGYKNTSHPQLRKYTNEKYYFEYKTENTVKEIQKIMPFIHVDKGNKPIEVNCSNKFIFIYMKTIPNIPITVAEIENLYQVTNNIIESR